MNALGLYFAITSGEREQRWTDDDERAASLARTEARSMPGREPVRRMGRLADILRVSARRLIAGSVARGEGTAGPAG